MKKEKIFKTVCATFLAAATIGLIVPKAVDGIFEIQNGKSITAAAQTAGKVDLSVSSVTVEPGGDFELTVDISGVSGSGINCCEFGVKFDSDAVSISSVTNGSVLPVLDEYELYVDETSNMICLGYTGIDTAVTKDGSLLVIKGTVKNSVANGSKAEFKIVPIDRPVTPGSTELNNGIYIAYFSEDALEPTTFESEISNGAVEIKEKPVTTTVVTTPVTTTATTVTTTKVTEPITTTPVTTTKVTTIKPVTTTKATTTKVTTTKPVTTTKVTTTKVTTTKPVTTTKVTTTKVTTTKPVTTTKVTTTSTVPPTDPTQPTTFIWIDHHKRGDLNSDNDVNIADLVLMQKYLVGKATLSVPLFISDVNDDGVVNVFDAVALRKYCLNN